MHIKVLMVSLLIIVTLSGCNNKGKSTYSHEDFEFTMKDMGYDFEIQDVDRDFLPTTRKRMTIDDIALDIYVFDSDVEAETEAGYIDEGWGYNNGRRAVKVSWISYPHFFKRGNIIVQYIGEDPDIINTLESIMGEQFAGDTPK